jgi:hypothetical protein
MRSALAARLAVALGSAALFLLLCGGSCQVSTSWCSDEHCVNGCACDGGSCCSLGTCCDEVSDDSGALATAIAIEQRPDAAPLVVERRVCIDARGRVTRLDVERYELAR